MTASDPTDLKAPFPWFGGKSRVASEVWSALGPVDNFVEPFAGSLAVLLNRPDDRWETGSETVNDLDCYLANFWRALAHDPEEVAHWCDWPVNECDLLARHLWLVQTGRERIAKLEADPDFYDAKVAGWWVWGINSWIGSGWCQGNGPWRVVDGKVVLTGGKGGQWRQLPDLGDAGRGVNRQRPHLGNREPGKELPQVWTHDTSLVDYFNALATRLRRVRVCCGDWSRVVTNGALAFGDSVGVFLDPPYSSDVRAKNLYRTDDHNISTGVREWALANGDDPRLRIVLAGYANEHEMPAKWRCYAYKANAAYQNSGGNGSNLENRKQERLWFSPHCLNPQPDLFA